MLNSSNKIYSFKSFLIEIISYLFALSNIISSNLIIFFSWIFKNFSNSFILFDITSIFGSNISYNPFKFSFVEKVFILKKISFKSFWSDFKIIISLISLILLFNSFKLICIYSLFFLFDNFIFINLLFIYSIFLSTSFLIE